MPPKKGRGSNAGARTGNGTADGQSINKWAVAKREMDCDNLDHGFDFWMSYKENDRFYIVEAADEQYWYAEKQGAHSGEIKKVLRSDVEFEHSDGESNGAATGEKREAADAPATEMRKKSKTEGAPVVHNVSEAEGAERSLDAEAPRHMQSEPYVSQVAPKSCKSLQKLFKSDKARVFIDFDSFERSQAIHLQVEEILDGQVLREAEDFADLISPVFRVVLQGASGGKVTDGQTVDLIVELEDFANKLNPDSLVFIKKSDELDSMWCGVSGGTFDLVPSESGQGLLLRARVATDSFSWWGIAKCHVKVAAHHIESDGRRTLRFIVYSGAPVGSYPIPRNIDEVRKDPASSRNTLVPMLHGFFMYQHSKKREEVVLRDGLDFTIQVQEKKNGVVKSSSGKWCHGSSIDWTTVEIDVHDIDVDSELEVKMSRKSIRGRFFGSRDGIREFTLKSTNLKQKFLPHECETCTSFVYWCNLDKYTGPQKSITCGYCLSCNEEPSEEVWVKGLGGKIKLGGCCKIVRSELMGQLSTSADAESETRGGKVPQVRDQSMIDITDGYALLIGNSHYEGTVSSGGGGSAATAALSGARDETTANVEEMAYSMLKILFEDNRLSYDVCEKVRLHFNVKCIEDMSYLEDRDIAQLELPLVDCRKLEKLVQEVRSPSFKKPAKEALPHAEMPGHVDAEIPRFALTVGINNYTHLGTLPYCRQDAMAMAEELKQHNFRVHTLVDCEKADMDREMDKWLEELPASSPFVAVLHFSGHGYEIDGENFLVPNDADCKTQDDVKKKCISLKKMLSNIGSKFGGSILVILLLDCCRAGMKNPNLKSSFAKLEVTSHLTRTFVGHATAPGTLAQADHHRCPNLSPFTYALVDCLKNSEIASQDIGVFFRAVRGLVEDLTGGKQRPFEESNIRESFRFKEMQYESNVAAGGGGRSKHSEKAEQLAQMGFDKARALEILDIVDGSVDLALDMLSS